MQKRKERECRCQEAKHRHKEEMRRRQKEEIVNLNREKESLQAEFANLKGSFAAKRRKEITRRLTSIEAQLALINKDLSEQ